MTSHTLFLEKGDPAVTQKVLRSLPDWFALESAIISYIDSSSELPMFIAYRDKSPVGFISLKHHNPYTSEIYVMGVLSEYHRSGIGKSLLNETERYLQQNKVEFLQVKTLGESRECIFYKKTRLFYKSMGFREVEVFPTLWGEDNPCLLLIKNLNREQIV